MRKAATTHPKVIQRQNSQAFNSTTTTRKWDLYSAVCLERHPVIIQPMQEIEEKFYNTLKRIEYEYSSKSDHELRVEKEKELKNSGNDEEARDILIQTAQDFEDSSQEELSNFTFALTITSMFSL